MTPTEVAALLESNQREILAELGAEWLPKGIYTFIVETAVKYLIQGVRNGVVQPGPEQARLVVSLPDSDWAEFRHPRTTPDERRKVAAAIRKALSSRRPQPWTLAELHDGSGQPIPHVVVKGGVYRSTDGLPGRPPDAAAETGVWLRVLEHGRPVTLDGLDPAAVADPLKVRLERARQRRESRQKLFHLFETAFVRAHLLGEPGLAEAAIGGLEARGEERFAAALRRTIKTQLAKVPRPLVIAVLTALLAGGIAVAIYFLVKHLKGHLLQDPQRQGQVLTKPLPAMPLLDSRTIRQPRVAGRIGIYSEDGRNAVLIFTPSKLDRLSSDSNIEWRWWIKEGQMISTVVTGPPETAHAYFRSYDPRACDVDIDMVEYYESQHAKVGQRADGLLDEIGPTSGRPVGSPAPEVVVTTETEHGPFHRVLTGGQVGGPGGPVALRDTVIGVAMPGMCRSALPPPEADHPSIVLFSCPTTPGRYIVGVAAKAIEAVGRRVELEFGDGTVASDVPPVEVDDQWSAYLLPRYMRMYAADHTFTSKGGLVVSAWAVRGAERRLLVRQRVTVP